MTKLVWVPSVYWKLVG